MLTFNEFKAEMDIVQQQVLDRVLPTLAELGMTEEGLTFVRELKGYPRTPYYTTLWVLDDTQRKDLGVAICIHAIGIKLLDDIIDADQPLSPRDQIFGIFLLQMAEAIIGGYHNVHEVLKTFEMDYKQIWRQEVHEKRVAPDTLEDWIEAARIKAGLMLANYGAVVCLASDLTEWVEPARTYSEALAVLYMMGDDWTDFEELGEREGNLAHLIGTGKVSMAELTEAVGFWQRRANEAAKQGQTACDIEPFVNHFAKKIIGLFQQVPVSVA